MKPKLSTQASSASSKEELELEKIKDGLKSGAADDEILEMVPLLKGRGFVPKGTLKAKRKTGPKKKLSINQTEEAIRTRLESIRLILGKQAKWITANNLLFTVGWIVNEFNDLCSTGLFIDSEQHAVIHVIATELPQGAAVSEITGYLKSGGAISRSLYAEIPIPDDVELMAWLENMLLAVEEKQRKNWNDWVKGAVCDAIFTADNKFEERDYYEAINIELRRGAGYKPKADSNRNELLGASLEKLQRIRSVLNECVYLSVDDVIENLYFYLRGISQAYDPNSGVRLPASLSKLIAVFHNAIKRQSISPFRAIFAEDYDF